MNLKEIEKLADLMISKGLTSVEYGEGDKRIKLEKIISGTDAAGEYAPPAADNSAPRTETADPALHTVASPIVGVFYAAPAPDAKPFVSLGDRVKPGDVLCVVEAMKMMNEITSDVAGEIAELCTSNKQIVEYGQPLFKVRAL
jgi:acetyl-CoA carboxylase biotin carboxyl carrier protein